MTLPERIDRLPPQLASAAVRMRGFPAPWCVAGGWALDLFLGRLTRSHADVDLAIFRDDQGQLHRHLAGWAFQKVIGGQFADWPAGEWLSLPIHEIHARSPDAREPTLEFLLNERVGDEWAFRRDPALRCPLRHVIGTSASGVPVLCPAVVLLYKAKHPRPADEADFRAVVDHLAPDRRTWLRAALTHSHPHHPWLASL